MRRTAAFIVAATFTFSAPLAALAAEHDAMPMEHGSMGTEHGGHMMHKNGVIHEEVVSGVKATFRVLDMREHMKAAKMEMPKGMKDTHHLMVELRDAKTGKVFTEGEVRVKLQAPDKSEQIKNLMSMGAMPGMGAGFGADFNLSQKGKYGIMTKFKLADGKVRTVKFWYTVK